LFIAVPCNRGTATKQTGLRQLREQGVAILREI
jgi:hypothetical protein